eukprot:gene392-21898_t
MFPPAPVEGASHAFPPALVEGASHKGRPAAAGESTYNWRHAPGDGRAGVEWAYPGSTIGDVTWSNGASLFDYVHHDRVALGDDGWVAIDLAPALAHALVLDQRGLLLTDPSQMNGDPGWSEPYGAYDHLDLWV